MSARTDGFTIREDLFSTVRGKESRGRFTGSRRRRSAGIPEQQCKDIIKFMRVHTRVVEVEQGEPTVLSNAGIYI